MNEPQENKGSQATPPQRSEREIPLDTQLLSEAVIELNISRKNVGIYPPGHIQITRSIDRAYQILQKMFELRAEMTLGVAKDTLLVGQDYLDQKNPVYRDFALSMSQQEIAAVTFISGLTKEELVRFHRILTTKPEDIRTSGGITKVMTEAGIPHIRIHAIDYGSFHVTEEQEICKSPTKGAGGEKAGAGLWQDFVAHLSAGTLAGPGQGVSVKDAERIDPAALARLLNERKLDSGAALQSYDRIISDHMRVRAEKRELTHEQSATLENMSKLLNDLHPELRKQFLSVAFSRISTHAALVGADELLGGFPDDMVITMLRQASAEGREISPTLTGLLGKLTKAKAESARSGGLPGAGGPVTLKSPDSAPILPEHMQKLFDREKYEEYVSEDYEAMLRRLTEGVGPGGEQFLAEEYAKTLGDEYVDFQIGRALLAFMEEDIDEEDYREFARKLVAIVMEFLKSGNFALLTDILETLRRHVREKTKEGMRAEAEESLKIFKAPEFITKAVEAFDVWARNKGREAAAFLLALGPETVPGLMDIFATDESPGGRRVLFDLLCNFGKPTVREALIRLRDPRAYYVRNLVMLLRYVGPPTVAPSIKLLMKHSDEKVRNEARTALLRFKDPEAVQILREAVHSKDPDVASQAVHLAGQYRVAEITEDILSRIKKVILFEEDYTVNEEIIRALGEIGDPRAITDLERFARARSLYPQRRAKMQLLLFESLGRYPKASIAGLLEIGERSEDERIRRLCQKLRARK